MSQAVDWVARARSLREEIAAAQDEMDEARRLPDQIAHRLAEAGIFRLCVPEAYGGVETSPKVLVETLEALAETDASAAWVAMIAATTGALAAYMDPAAAGEIFGDPMAVVTGVYAPLGKAAVEGDQLRVSGQWKWNSGGQNSRWIAGGCMLTQDGQPLKDASGAPLMRMAFAPRSAVTFIDTWRTGGLKGTGSGDMAMSDLLVPRTHSVSLTHDAPRINAPLYAFPAFGLLAMGIAAVASGNAKAALAEFAAMAKSKRMPNGRTLAERGATQAMYAQAKAQYGGARALLFAEIEGAWEEARAGGAITLERRAELRLAATHMTRTAADIVRTVQDYAGGASVFSSDPLQRRLRDAQTATAHIMIAPATWELVGRVLLGGAASTAEL